jgi:Leucine-rich repeat (LRR) protein
MKVLIPIVIGLLVVGCGKKEQQTANESNNAPIKTAKKKAEKETRRSSFIGNPLTKGESAKLIETAIRKAAKKLTGELTKADYEKVTELSLVNNQLSNVKGLEKLTQLMDLELSANQLTDVKSL